eukprot:scaffold92401_cov21-Phaeocystis_antarctica.AAC.1
MSARGQASACSARVPFVLNLRRAAPCRRHRRCAVLLHARSRVQRSPAPSHLCLDALFAGHIAH